MFLCFVEIVENVDEKYHPPTTENKNFKIL